MSWIFYLILVDPEKFIIPYDIYIYTLIAFNKYTKMAPKNTKMATTQEMIDGNFVWLSIWFAYPGKCVGQIWLVKYMDTLFGYDLKM